MKIMGDYLYRQAKPLPVILLLDTSGSMTVDNNIGTMNQAVREMLRDFQKAATSEVGISVAIITFGKNTGIYKELTDVGEIDIASINMDAYGMTPMGEAIKIAKNLVEDHDKIPSRSYRPTIVLVSDGEPNDSWEKPLESLINDGRSAKCYRMAMGIGAGQSGPAYDVLRKFVSNEEQVFTANDAGEISKFFQYVTMSTTGRTSSANPNVVPKRDSIIGAQEPNEEPEDDIDALLPY